MRGFFGWQVVAAAFVLAVFAWGVGFYGPGVYLHALHAREGWSLSLISAAMRSTAPGSARRLSSASASSACA